MCTFKHDSDNPVRTILWPTTDFTLQGCKHRQSSSWPIGKVNLDYMVVCQRIDTTFEKGKTCFLLSFNLLFFSRRGQCKRTCFGDCLKLTKHKAGAEVTLEEGFSFWNVYIFLLQTFELIRPIPLSKYRHEAETSRTVPDDLVREWLGNLDYIITISQ